MAGGLNLYGFAGGDPVNFSDPFGLFPCPPCDEEEQTTGQRIKQAAEAAVANAINDAVEFFGNLGNKAKGFLGFLGREAAVQGGITLATGGLGAVPAGGARGVGLTAELISAFRAAGRVSIEAREGMIAEAVTRRGLQSLATPFQTAAGRMVIHSGGVGANLRYIQLFEDGSSAFWRFNPGRNAVELIQRITP